MDQSSQLLWSNILAHLPRLGNQDDTYKASGHSIDEGPLCEVEHDTRPDKVGQFLERVLKKASSFVAGMEQWSGHSFWNHIKTGNRREYRIKRYNVASSHKTDCR